MSDINFNLPGFEQGGELPRPVDVVSERRFVDDKHLSIPAVREAQCTFRLKTNGADEHPDAYAVDLECKINSISVRPGKGTYVEILLTGVSEPNNVVRLKFHPGYLAVMNGKEQIGYFWRQKRGGGGEDERVPVDPDDPTVPDPTTLLVERALVLSRHRGS